MNWGVTSCKIVLEGEFVLLVGRDSPDSALGQDLGHSSCVCPDPWGLGGGVTFNGFQDLMDLI